MAMYEIAASNVNAISLLTLAQFNNYNDPTKDPSTYKIPPIKGGGPWWLSTAGDYTRCMYVVLYNKVTPYSAVVNGGLKVRPVLTLKSSIVTTATGVKVGDTVSFGNTTWIVLSGTFVICEDSIGSCAYRDDWKATDALDYNKSTIKTFLTEWLNYWKG